MVALITSIVVTGGMIVAVIQYGKRRPTSQPTTWGEAMIGAVYVFLLLMLVFGVVPDRWIRLTDNEWGWSVERFLFVEGQFLKSPITFPPTRLDLKKVSDIVVVVQHVAALVGLPMLWVWWQRRDERTAAPEAASDFGRPLVKGN